MKPIPYISQIQFSHRLIIFLNIKNLIKKQQINRKKLNFNTNSKVNRGKIPSLPIILVFTNQNNKNIKIIPF